MKNMDSLNPNNMPRPPKIAVSTANKQVSLLNLRQKNPPKKTFRRILLFIVIAILLLGVIVTLRAANLSQKIFVGQKTTFFGKIVDLIRGGGDNAKLEGEDLGQINILLLGIGGEGHDGPYLTDTMILAQIRPDIGEVTLTSIPRDYLVDLPNNLGQDKINAAFTYGLLDKNKNKDWDAGGAAARKVVESISGLKIPYFAVVDFSGFEQAVNKIGGLDIQIDNTFTDYSYPDSGTGYLPAVTFTKGREHMDGTRALEFARSRHGTNNEGSDFARSVRQQKIISAFKQKVLSLNLIKDAGSLNDLLGIFADHFHTNISPAQLLRVNNLLKNKGVNVMSLSLDPDTGLICPEILASNSAYVLVPCNSADDITAFFKNSFAAAKLKEEQSVVWLANSTNNKAALDTAMRKLQTAGVTVYELNYSKDNLPQTTVYQVNPKPATAEYIANELGGTIVNLAPPGVTADPKKVDLVVVLGKNALVEPAPTPYIRPPAKIATSTPDSASTTPTSTTTPAKATTTK